MEDLPLGRIAALLPEVAVNDLPLGRTLMMMIYCMCKQTKIKGGIEWHLLKTAD